MIGWSFPSRNFGPIDGPTDAGLQWFKDEPIRALARELCQNSLDAVNNDTEPVRIDFILRQVSSSSFPGINQFKNILRKCEEFWIDKTIKRKDAFLKQAQTILNTGKIYILQVSDYNTIGLEGAFDEGITVWKSLVQGNGISMKLSDDSAGSYGIGKAAPFVNSFFQTVFYRTLDRQNISAAQGVAQLMSFKDESYGDADPIRRSIGYYGDTSSNMPLTKIEELNCICGERKEIGTDVIIMGFNANAGRENWYAAIILEILENFFMSIMNRKLIINVGGHKIDHESVFRIIARFCKSEKGVVCYKKVFSSQGVLDLKKDFHGGILHLKLLYGANLNKNILITRNSGMKIAEIAGLPKGISYTGILEIQGKELNSFFKEMEDPQHRRWDIKRHNDPKLAKEYKEELENWIKSAIIDNSDSQLGETTEVIIIDDFLSGNYDNDTSDPFQKRENVIDNVKYMEMTVIEPKRYNTKEHKITKDMVKGKTIPGGSQLGYRTPTEKQNGGLKKGRDAKEDINGNDKVYKEMFVVQTKSRVISNGNNYSLKIIPGTTIIEGRIDIRAIGENGKDTKLMIKSAFLNGEKLLCADGSIQIKNVHADEKLDIEFELVDIGNFGMRVNVYGY